MIPTATPTPIPAFAPASKPPLEGLLRAAGVEEACGVVVAAPGRVFEEVIVADVGEEDSVEDEVGVELDAVVASRMFQPATAMAPTVEDSVSVVFTVVQSVEASDGVDA